MNNLILIVDDSLTVRSDLEEAFGDEQLETISCATIAAARAMLEEEPIGLIVLDVLLPDGDGIDLLKEIRATPKLAELPVLILSTEAEVRDRIRGLTTGSNDYVGKPYEREYVMARARELLNVGKGGKDSKTQGKQRSRVLIIDDSLTFRNRLSELLSGQGFEVLCADTGEDGLRSAAIHRPAAVVVDGVLPGIDGPTVVRRLRLDAALRHTPCILLTGSESYGVELRALDSGADAFVRKEEDPDVILARVTAVLRNAERNAPDSDTASLHSPKRILAVDDSLTYLYELNSILSGEGYDVILAHSGEEALEMLGVQSVDCILLDRLMPGMGGTEACRLIKSTASTRDIPLIMLTAMEDRDAMIEGLSTGADDYVLKSNEMDVLKARVRAQLRRKQFEDESRRIRAELMSKELEATEARAARELAESRAELLAILERKNHDLEAANEQLTESQRQIAEKNTQLQEASRLKSEFLSSMSHELRTPLNAIIGFSEVLKDGVFGELSPRQTQYITQVFDSGQHLLSLINDILDLSKVEAGKMTLDLEEIALNNVLGTSLHIVMEKAVKEGVTLHFDAYTGDDAIVVDTRKFKQIVYNLLSNAVKFSPHNGHVHLSARRVHKNDLRLDAPEGMATRMIALEPSEFEHFVEIRVADEGIGIAEEDLPKLFESFRQLGSGLTRPHEGTGLGLSLVLRLADLHRGTVGVASALQRGTHFVVWLPWRTSQINPSLEQLSPSDWLGPGVVQVALDGPTRQALVIDDNTHAATLLRIHLESIGFQVRCAQDAQNAVQMAQQLPPDLITLDLLMPDASGWAVLERLRAHEELEAVPVVIVSILADEQRGFAVGATKMLQKPVVRNALLETIDSLGLLNSQAIPVATVLVVDDDQQACTLVHSCLEGPYCKVLHAYDGQSAIETITQIRPDLIILDLLLPDMTGFEVVDRLRNLHDPATMPILIWTAQSISREDRERLQGRVLQIIEKGNFNRQHFLMEVGRALRPEGWPYRPSQPE
jgi:DNA-binding response OmpR family regulator